jgi:hypothetical protein
MPLVAKTSQQPWSQPPRASPTAIGRQSGRWRRFQTLAAILAVAVSPAIGVAMGFAMVAVRLAFAVDLPGEPPVPEAALPATFSFGFGFSATADRPMEGTECRRKSIRAVTPAWQQPQAYRSVSVGRDLGRGNKMSPCETWATDPAVMHSKNCTSARRARQ